MNLNPYLPIKNVTFSTKKMTFDYSRKNAKKGEETNTQLTIEAEDIVAIFAGVVAVMIVVAMIAGWVPINKITAGLASFSGAGVIIAKIVKARGHKNPAQPQSDAPDAANHDNKTQHPAHQNHHAGHKKIS